MCCVIHGDVIIGSLYFPGVERDSRILTLISPPLTHKSYPPRVESGLVENMQWRSNKYLCHRSDHVNSNLYNI